VTLIRKVRADVLKFVKPKDESEYLKHLLLSLSHDADIVLDLHCDYQAALHVYMGSPLWPQAADLPAQLGAEVTLLAKASGENPFEGCGTR
jgi:predicted deacylase